MTKRIHIVHKKCGLPAIGEIETEPAKPAKPYEQTIKTDDYGLPLIPPPLATDTTPPVIATTVQASGMCVVDIDGTSTSIELTGNDAISFRVW